MSVYAAYMLAGVCVGGLTYEVWIAYRRWSTRRAINRYLDWKDEP